MTKEQVLNAALALPPLDREVIAEQLMLSIDPKDVDELDRKWIEIAEARADDIESGRVKPVSAQEMFDRIESRFPR